MDVSKHRLWTHPAEPSVAVDSIDFKFERRSATSLRFRFEVRGRIDEIVLPARAAPLRTSGLWESTCFEVFLRPAEFSDYRELNFSPSSQWAAYAFSSHRKGMMHAAVPAPPVIEVTAGPARLTADVAISLDLPDEPYLIAAAAVIEETRGGRSLWALSHEGSVPDFHHPSCFTLELPAAPRP
ncbi:MAG TPA: DOMON-like domain-containing protein [Allosphingosinicella sp.]|jgi:hypothetical protein|nr:DOMON-like domain-containing protein [Allosphingosinicella sp.]